MYIEMSHIILWCFCNFFFLWCFMRLCCVHKLPHIAVFIIALFNSWPVFKLSLYSHFLPCFFQGINVPLFVRPDMSGHKGRTWHIYFLYPNKQNKSDRLIFLLLFNCQCSRKNPVRSWTNGAVNSTGLFFL